MTKAVIIIARNEGEWTLKTANSFKAAMPDAEIIGIDDGGKNNWPDFVKVHDTGGGLGVGMSRQIGAQVAEADLIVVTDGHVLFDSGDIDKAWDLASKGYIVNPTTKSIKSGKKHGNGRTHTIPDHKTINVRTYEGEEVGLIGSVYFMKRDVALDIMAPTPAHGFNEHIMTCAAFCLGYKIYTLPQLVFSHLYKSKFNYKLTYQQQHRNKELLDWWFFKRKSPAKVADIEEKYRNFIKANRLLTVSELTDKFNRMNNRIKKQNKEILDKKNK